MIRIGCVPYLNALPLVEGFETSTNVKIFWAPPSQLDQAIKNQDLDVALLPVVSYLENNDLKLIPGMGIASSGEVKSVRTFHENENIDLKNTSSIFLDPHSKTSQRLLKVILEKKYFRNLDKIHWITQINQADTILQIGDSALLKNPYYENFNDLGTEWFQLTGLPFVYACWMSRGELSPDLLEELQSASIRGQQNLESIAYSQDLIDPEGAFEYLSNHIHYKIQEGELIGMKLFFDWVTEIEEKNYDTTLRFVA